MNVETDGELATVWETISFTMNLGDFNSMKVEFGQARKCKNNQQEISKCATIIHKHNQFLLEKRVEEMKDIRNEING